MADNNIDPELLREISEQFAAMAATLGKFGQTTGTASATVAGQTAAIKASTSATTGFNDALGKGIAAKKAETDEVLKAAESAKRWNAAGSAAAATAQQLTSTLLSANKGMTSLNSTIDSATSAASGLAKSFGSVGFAVGLVIEAAGYVAKQVNVYADALLTAKDELASFGAVGALTSTNILELAKGAQYTSTTLSGFTKPLKGLGTDIISLSSTVNGGVAEFAKLAEVSRDQIDNYRAMGVSQEQFTQNTADYIKLQAGSGRLITEQMKRDGSLKKASQEYTDNLLQLASISALTIDQSKKVMEQATASNDIQIKDRLDQLKIIELRKNQNDLAANQEADQLQRAMDVRTKFLQTIASIGDSNMLAAAQSRAATDAWTPVSAVLLRTVDGADELFSKMKRGIDVSAEVQDKMVAGVNKNILALGTTATFNKETGAQFGLTNELLKWTGPRTGEGKSAATAMATAKTTVEAGVAGKSPASIENDKLEEMRALRERASYEAQKLRDEMLAKLIKTMGVEELARAAMIAGIVAATAALAALAATGMLARKALGAGGGLGIPDSGKPGKGAPGTKFKVGAGVGAMALGMATPYAADKLTESGHPKLGTGVDVLGTTASYASMGAMAGPWGAAGGAAIGLGVGLYQNWDKLFGEKGVKQIDEKLAADSAETLETVKTTKGAVALNKALSEVTESLNKITTGTTTGTTSSVSGGTGGPISGKTKQAMDFFMAKGWTKEQAAGLVGNFEQESNLDPTAENTKEGAYGIGQWRGSRIADFEKFAGKSIRGSSMEEQLAFAQHELQNKEAKAGRELRMQTTVEGSAGVVDKRYERSAGTELQRRIAYANAAAGTSAVSTPTSTTTPVPADTSATPVSPINAQQKTTDSMISLLSDKLDVMITRLSTSNELQERILRHSRV